MGQKKVYGIVESIGHWQEMKLFYILRKILLTTALLVSGESLEQVTNPHVRMSLQLQAAFGLRREEAIKFQPSYADRGDHIALKGSWTKGGRERTVPITATEQRDMLQAAHRLAGTGSQGH